MSGGGDTFFCSPPSSFTSSVTLPALRRSGCLTQEKIVAGCAKHFIVIADYRFSDAHLWPRPSNA